MKKTKVLITGGAGFVGTHLVKYLLGKKNNITVFDLLDFKNTDIRNKQITYFRGDLAIKKNIDEVFKHHGPFDIVYHLASAMPNKAVSDKRLWEINVGGTKNLAEVAAKNKVKTFIFTSSNVTYGIPKTLPVTENTPLDPLEIYGKSKQQAENELAKFKKKMNIQIIRCPVISGVGRLGLQAILFEFISENKKIYLLGDGSNKYQFVDVMDVVDALEKASHIKGFDIYYIGADEVLTLKEIYQRVIRFAGSASKIVSLPKVPSLAILALLDRLNISPLGVYQYTMLGRSIYADTKKIKRKLSWKPAKTNIDTFIDNYKWYKANKKKFVGIETEKASSNKSLPKMGVFKVLKLLS